MFLPSRYGGHIKKIERKDIIFISVCQIIRTYFFKMKSTGESQRQKRFFYIIFKNIKKII